MTLSFFEFDCMYGGDPVRYEIEMSKKRAATRFDHIHCSFCLVDEITDHPEHLQDAMTRMQRLFDQKITKICDHHQEERAKADIIIGDTTS